MAPLIQVIEILGTFAFALSGMLTARRRHMDFVGVYTVAFVTAFGGGTLRDLLLDHRPFYWIEHPSYAVIIFVLAAISVLLAPPQRGVLTEKIIFLPDALGLGLFSAAGVTYGLSAGITPFLAAMMGVLTATFGGVLRDVLCNEIPSVFQQTQLYATCAFLGAWCYILVWWITGDSAAGVVVCTVVTVVIRLAAVRYNWKLPF